MTARSVGSSQWSPTTRISILSYVWRIAEAMALLGDEWPPVIGGDPHGDEWFGFVGGGPAYVAVAASQSNQAPLVSRYDATPNRLC